MKVLYHYVRSVRRQLVEREGVAATRARDFFFAQLTVAAFCHRGVFQPQVRESLDLSIEAFHKVVGGVPDYVRRAAVCNAFSISIPSEIVAALEADPTQIGWAFQFWNEAERDESTFAISRQGSQEMSIRSLTAATQLFTEDYMAEVLVERCLVGQEGVLGRDVLDPACGTGHILVHALRGIRASRESTEGCVESFVSRMFGCDIDPDAVELCRVVVFLEAAIASVAQSGLRTLWHIVTSNIQHLSSAHGTLDRATECSLLHRTYGCILANPPYIGRRKLTDEMRCFLDTEYSATSMDLCSAFMQRCTELLEPGGWLGLVTVDKWLRLKGYEVLRTGGSGFAGLYRMLMLDLVCELGQRAFSPWSSLHDGVGIALITAQNREPPRGHSFRFVSCADEVHHARKAAMLKGWRATGEEGTKVLQRQVMTREGSTSFVANHGIVPSLISSRQKVGDVAEVIVGLQTGDDRRFVRYVWSVPPDKERWLIHSKGGGYDRWYGLNRFLLDWEQGKPVFEKNPKSGFSVERWFPVPGWTYTWFANGSLGLRKKDAGWSFGRAAASGFFCDDDRLVGFLNSRVASFVARRIGGKTQLPEGIVRSLPIPASLDGIDARLVEAAVALKRAIVERDLTDASFRPASSFEPLTLCGLHALLLVVEGELERQVCELLGMDDALLRSLDDVMGRPVAWNPLCVGLDDEVVWSCIPGKFHSIRSLVRCRLSAAVEIESCTERVRSYFTVGTKMCAPSRPLPATSLLEQIGRLRGVHPFDVVRALSTLHSVDARVASEVIGSQLRSRIVEVVLRELGHQWWATTEVYDPSLLCERSTQDLTDAAVCDLSGFDCDKILGEPIGAWIVGKMNAWHSRLFHNEPLLVEQRTNAKRGGSFGHRWRVAPSTSACGIPENQGRGCR